MEQKKPSSIQGVQVLPLVTHPDDRGYFRELFRQDKLEGFSIAQTSVTQSYPGVIKAFHWHAEQSDAWYVAHGMIQAVFYDRRDGSPTKGVTQVVYAGEQNPVLIVIPPGVAHGYRVLGNEPIVLIYHTTKEYNGAKPDEHRIPHDDPTIGFDWQTKPR